MSKNETSERHNKRRKVTLYDAVAGRASYEGFLARPKITRHRDRTSNTLTPIPPEEVLFGYKDAPNRYEEDDIYFADRHLDQSSELQRLPDSDLLKALHAYASDFYATTAQQGRSEDYGSMDETALLALGILIEEAASDAASLAQPEGESVMDDDSESEATSSSMKSEGKLQVEKNDMLQRPRDGMAKIEPNSDPERTQSTLRSDIDLKPNPGAVGNSTIAQGRIKMEIDSDNESYLPTLSGSSRMEL